MIVRDIAGGVAGILVVVFVVWLASRIFGRTPVGIAAAGMGAIAAAAGAVAALCALIIAAVSIWFAWHGTVPANLDHYPVRQAAIVAIGVAAGAGLVAAVAAARRHWRRKSD